MESSILYQLIQSFSTIERKEARRFLASPYFNTREDLLLIFDGLCRSEQPDKQQLWQLVCPGKTFDDTALRLLMSYLNRLMDTFLLVQECNPKTLRNRLQLALVYRNRGLMRHHERNIRAFQKELEQQPLRNAQYHSLLRDYHFEVHLTTIAQKPTDTNSLRTLAQSTDVQYLCNRLQLICLELAQKNIYRTGEDDPLHRDVIALAERPDWRDLPGISIYLATYNMLLHPAEDVYYQTFKHTLAAVERFFSADEMREFYMFSINLCIKRANGGEKEMEKEILQLYRAALEAGYLFENGILSRFTYHNIVASGLRCGELDWVEGFIQRYNPMLERKFRDSSMGFNLARLYYERGQYDSVLSLLQKADYQEPLFSLASKTLLLKSYYVLGEYDLLHSHLDAMRNYIHRKKVIGYHRTNFLNIIRYTERILDLNNMDRASKAKLRQEIELEPVLTEKEWLLGWI